MKYLVSLVLSLALSSAAHAQATRDASVRAYAEKAFLQYSASLEGARKIQAAVETLLKNPTEENLAKARTTWTEERKIYSQTEIYRFYGSPIDDEDGPEGLINAWPLDESYIETIIERTDLYPKINAEVLRDLNEKDGEKNISTGYHAIEFMLWGQDTSAEGPGNRAASYFDAKQSPLAARRAQYLREVTAMLINDIESVQVEWDLNRKNSYAQTFVADSKTALTNMLTGVVKMTGAELSQERMFVALDTREQEEEHSCFSDTTHFDILYNFTGAKIVLQGVIELIRAEDRFVAAEIEDNLAMTEAAIMNMPTPFDQAIVSETGRARVMDAIAALETLTEAVRQGGVTLGVELP